MYGDIRSERMIIVTHENQCPNSFVDVSNEKNAAPVKVLRYLSGKDTAIKSRDIDANNAVRKLPFGKC